MPRFEKWLTTATPDTPADSVARAALAERLLAVQHFLERSVGSPDEPEAIHQLRVWTRRASAALKLFEPALPASRQRRMKKLLRKLRRAAGAVRDCDLHLERLKQDKSSVPKRVAKTLTHRRRAARQKLKKLRRRLEHNGKLDNQIEQLLERIGWPKRHSSREPPAFGPFCRQQLQPLANEFFRLAKANLRENATLHALRIAGKRLRYALELAPAAFPPREHQGLSDYLKLAQDRLGEVCDQLAAIDHLRECLDEAKKKSHRRRLAALLKKEERRLKTLRTKLLRWWPAAHRRVSQQWKKAL